jgi:hypothetical protein
VNLEGPLDLVLSWLNKEDLTLICLEFVLLCLDASRKDDSDGLMNNLQFAGSICRLNRIEDQIVPNVTMLTFLDFSPI